MSLTLTAAPSCYPITLDEAKHHCVVEHNIDDALIATYIAAATEYAENYLELDLVQKTWAYSFDSFPGTSAFKIPKSPVISISSIVYIDSDGISQTLSTDVYDLDSGLPDAEVFLKYDQTWPSSRGHRGDVTVTFVSGHEGLGSPVDLRGNIPESVKAAIKLIVGDLYLTRERKTDIQLYTNDTAEMLLRPYRLYQV